MARFSVLCILALAACLPGLAGAQVAATDLIPGGARYARLSIVGFNSTNYAPDNPAALLWARPWRIGAGSLQLESTDSTGASASAFSGGFIGTRLVGKTLAFGAEYLSVAGDAAGAPQKEQIFEGHVAVKVQDWLSLGLSRFRNTVEDATDTSTLDGFTLGTSLRLGEWLYLGAAMGADAYYLSSADDLLATNRDTRMFGIGIRTSGDTRVYMEVYTLLKGNFEPGDPPDPNIPDGRYIATTGAFQVIASSMLFGAAYTTIDIENGASEAEIIKIDLGYAPSDGLSITLRFLSMEEISAAAPGAVIQNITSSGAISYLF